MFKKLLIANRGEIACRIIRSAKKLNIRTVAVYSEIDASALHVLMADEAYCIGPALSSESYLNGEKIIAVAKQSQADAVHPGYGFLSEDDEFAKKCEENGIIFVGPSAYAIQMMGDKNLAKTAMQKAGVPVVPGYHGEQLDIAVLKKEAEKTGFPLLIKASAGGGGKGMRLVQNIEELEEAVNGARREAQAGFGDSRVFIEKYLVNSRHIELQILFDSQGHGVTLFDRDCSIQRRHQKVIEEAPASCLKDSTRKKMAQTALKAGEAIRYRGAGTIEFLVDEKENFYFMEMNTRLQVEHPVTEMITGLDLVEWQLRIAAGEPLTLQQSDIKAHGHAVEARLYAENPQNNFMPSAGRLLYFQLPAEESGKIRIDTGFRQNDVISIYYDPLIAKIIVWGENRAAAVKMLAEVLAQTAVLGIHTNLTLLNHIARNSAFIEGKINTSFISQQEKMLLAPLPAPSDMVIALLCLALLHQQALQRQGFEQHSEDVFSPWFSANSWRADSDFVLNELYFYYKKMSWRVSVKKIDKGVELRWENKLLMAQAQWKNENQFTAQIESQEASATAVNVQRDWIIFYGGEEWRFSLEKPSVVHADESVQQGLKAPMPGTVVEVYVQPGQTVAKGDRLMVIEAMKMEHTLTAPRAGVIKTVFYEPGNRIQEGSLLFNFKFP